MNCDFNTRILEISIFIYPYLLQLMEISILLWVFDYEDAVFWLLFPRLSQELQSNLAPVFTKSCDLEPDSVILWNLNIFTFEIR